MSDVTEHFSLAEFRCAEGTPYPTEWVDDRLMPMCQMLEVIREAWGGPLVVISGYRTAAYNEARRRQSAGVAKMSQHIQGRAADIAPAGIVAARVPALHRAILSLYGDGKLPALGGLGIYSRWVHVDIRAHGDRLAQWTGT